MEVTASMSGNTPARAGAEDAPEPVRKPRRRLPSAERRQEFVTKAIEFFAEEGFDSSTRRLAKKLGVTQPLLYRYFPSKEDLIQEVYQAVYVNRWRPEWPAILSDRSRPLRERLNTFYRSYTDVIFDRTWLRIYLFSGLRGIEINRRYMGLVRERILEPIIAEALAAAGHAPRPATEEEVEYAWVVHSGLFYLGVRQLIYDSPIGVEKDRVIEDAVEAMLSGLDRKFSAAASAAGRPEP